MTEEKKPTVEEIKGMIGTKKVDTITIDGSVVRAYCQAIGDDSPKWKDTAPPGILTNANISSGMGALGIPWPYKRIVAAGADWEFYKPIKVGDTITSTHEFVSLEDKSGDKGPKVLMSSKSSHVNQKGELVAISIGRVMSY